MCGVAQAVREEDKKMSGRWGEVHLLVGQGGKSVLVNPKSPLKSRISAGEYQVFGIRYKGQALLHATGDESRLREKFEKILERQ